ncbi:MAG: phosphonate C-P lyase system protein PhnG [Gammaproteobacteria bacterium]|nr:phosphonate C-P lyase system protein PhnG [Rhodocyclaceae bacterium]MBU3908805.1 phosphonate C-P lyase system protein PhnG [Gammaproteobacteria bacterium]MBU3988414.1 phosphonate C-P lyase system protein PhnG [Gammaproteobacteria bacterium]MBU4004833.1 phosphonate C-P lyase system protein PhnG [Gammaproteobacteria bacterium]MBU4021436.1 phosphonate C-P lyase system protein PhnG [Gammaproteobacteria bacterium]
MNTIDTPEIPTARQGWLSVLAMAPCEALENALTACAPPSLTWLRQPQTGLFMVRARAGGTGAQFNLGEASVTRCAVQDEDGRIGIGYVRGGNARHAELVAIFDLLLQKDDYRAELLATVITPLTERQQAARLTKSRQAAATRVNFYTMAREQA